MHSVLQPEEHRLLQEMRGFVGSTELLVRLVGNNTRIGQHTLANLVVILVVYNAILGGLSGLTIPAPYHNAWLLMEKNREVNVTEE